MNLRTNRSHLPNGILSANKLAALIALLLAVGLTQPINAQTGSEYRPPQEIDGSRPASTALNQATSAQTQDPGKLPGKQIATQQAFDLLVKELDNLIPGDFEEGSAQKKAIEDAVTAFQLRDAKRVFEILNAQAAVDSEFPPTDLMLAALSYATKDQKSGRVLLERAGVQNPNSPPVYAAFSRLAINENRNIEALALLEKMARVIATAKLTEKSRSFYDAQYLDGMTDVAMRQQRYPDARTYLEKLRVLRPKDPKTLMVSAELEFKEKKLDKSMEYLTQLQLVLPHARAPETIIASWFHRTGQTDEAKKWMADAATKYADSPQVQLEVASWSVNDEDFPTASASIKKAEANGETPLSKSLKAKIAFAGESYGVAEAHYKELYLQNPDNFDAANMYALSLIESSDPEKRKLALDIANRNFRSLPDNIVAQAALGYVKLRLGDIEQAKSALGRALQSNTASPEIRFFGAAVLREMKEYENSKTVLIQALNHKGIFLYRTAAKKMLSELDAELTALKTDK